MVNFECLSTIRVREIVTWLMIEHEISLVDLDKEVRVDSLSEVMLVFLQSLERLTAACSALLTVALPQSFCSSSTQVPFYCGVTNRAAPQRRRRPQYAPTSR